MATIRDGGVFLDDPLSRVMLLALAGLIWYQGESLRSEIRDLRTEIGDLHTEMHTEIRNLRTEMRAEIGGLRTEIGALREAVADLEVAVAKLEGAVAGLEGAVAGLEVRVAKLDDAVARIDARRSLRLMLTVRFAASGEGASYGGPRIAAGLLLARALPEIDAVLSAIDQGAQSELAKELWEDRANILARASSVP